MDDETKEIKTPESKDPDETWGDALIHIDPDEPLKPRYRKLVEMAAQGARPGEIAKELGYSSSRISVILSNSIIKNEISKVQDKIYEESVGKRLKDMTEPALALVEKCLTDKTNRFKEQLKIETARWLIEKIDGKAIQKHELGGSVLIGVLDRLDAMKSSGRSLEDGEIDVSPERLISEKSDIIEIEPISKDKEEEERLAQWVKDL